MTAPNPPLPAPPRAWLLAPAVGVALVAAPGCLLRADPPVFTDRCIDEDIGEVIGSEVAMARTEDNASTYECDRIPIDGPDYVFAWTAPREGFYEFTIDGFDLISRSFGVTSPTCGGEIEGCQPITQSVRYSAQAGELVHVVIEYLEDDDQEFTLSISRSDSEGPYENDGQCDEPGGTDLCPSGSDPNDCRCPYEDDLECDEPEGTGLCVEGSDPRDCN